jgi:hypothetical protein
VNVGSGSGSRRPKKVRLIHQRAAAPLRSCRFGKSSASDITK